MQNQGSPIFQLFLSPSLSLSLSLFLSFILAFFGVCACTSIWIMEPMRRLYGDSRARVGSGVFCQSACLRHKPKETLYPKKLNYRWKHFSSRGRRFPGVSLSPLFCLSVRLLARTFKEPWMLDQGKTHHSPLTTHHVPSSKYLPFFLGTKRSTCGVCAQVERKVEGVAEGTIEAKGWIFYKQVPWGYIRCDFFVTTHCIIVV